MNKYPQKANVFQADRAGLAGEPGIEEMMRDNEGYIGIHFDNLYDSAGGDESGEPYNLARGPASPRLKSIRAIADSLFELADDDEFAA